MASKISLVLGTVWSFCRNLIIFALEVFHIQINLPFCLYTTSKQRRFQAAGCKGRSAESHMGVEDLCS